MSPVRGLAAGGVALAICLRAVPARAQATGDAPAPQAAQAASTNVATGKRVYTPADFALLFAPGGKIDQLFQQKLAPYVDTTTRPWKLRPVEGTPLGADNGSLPQFQRAAAI